MAIIGTLPNNIQDGQLADAVPVMADFNFIVNQVNANANPIGTLTAPSGTRTLFHQATAPVGWVTDASITDHTIQVNGTVSGGTQSGVTNYSVWFLGNSSTSNHVLSVGEMPAHNHTDSGHVHGTTDPGHHHQPSDGSAFLTNGSSANVAPSGTGYAAQSITSTVQTGLTINAGFANLQNTGGGAGHAHSLGTLFNYIACLIAQKS